jgi:hypothetical protein
MNRVVLLLMALALGGCLKAKFIDERPPDLLPPPPPPEDLASPPDLLPPPEDLASPPDLVGADLMGTTVATGSFVGRAGHAGSGSAALVDLGNGQFELRFGDDFSSSPVPGGEVYISSRSAFGNSVNDSTDIDLGALQRPSGAQSYLIPVDPGERRFAWVYCVPFRVEVAVAALAQ